MEGNVFQCDTVPLHDQQLGELLAVIKSVSEAAEKLAALGWLQDNAP